MSLIDERRNEIVVSTQVLVELYAVCTRELGMKRHAAREAVEAVEAVARFPVADTDRGQAFFEQRLTRFAAEATLQRVQREQLPRVSVRRPVRRDGSARAERVRTPPGID